ncbi:MAG: ABC transporter ATP-binding protein/permease [Alphaproteobacteria bacterium]|nr:ABC transporter ATP-binding protein/permease [Alphaproteobacteria bacterium]
MRPANHEPPLLDDPQHLKALRVLFPYLWPKGERDMKTRVVIAIICLVLAKVVTVLVPLVYKEVVAVMDASGEGMELMWPAVLIAGYGMGRFLSRAFAELRDAVFARVGQRAMRRIALRVFTHLHQLSLRFHLDRRTGGLSRMIERGTNGVDFILRFMLFNIIPTILELGFALILMWVILDWTYAAVTAFTVLVYAGFTFWVSEWRLKFRREMIRQDNAANTKAIDSLLNFETVKYYGNERHEARRFEDSMERYESAAVLNQTTLTGLNSGQHLIIALGLVGVMLMSATDYAAGRHGIDDFVFINTLLAQLFMPLGFLGFVYREMKRSLVDMEAMFRLLDEAPEVQDQPGAPDIRVSDGEIEFDDVSFSYETERAILHNVSFTVPAGQMVAIVGPSGAGKSTISRLLYRFYDVREGAIRIDGQDISRVTQDSLRRAIGVVPQDTVLFNDTIGYNIGYGRPGASQQEIEEAARMAAISDFIEKLPAGYDTMVGERGLKLSGGEKQRVAIARTIIKDPPILLLDEATSALDTNTEKEIQAALRNVAQDRSTLVIAHRLSTIVDADKIIVLDDGRIVESGRHEELVGKEGGLYAQMWQRQQEAVEAARRLEDLADVI